jgi:hypothetical protein
MDEFPRDSTGQPICARPCRDGTPCNRHVQIPGIACHLHEREDPILPLPLPDTVPTYNAEQDSE